MKKPLAIDLFCCLPKTQFFGTANAAIKELVTGGAQYPDHFWFGVLHHAMGALSCKFRAVRKFNNARFAACLALFRNLRISSAQASHQSPSSIVALCVVDFLLVRILLVPNAPLFPSRLSSAIRRAIALVRIWRRDCEMGTALAAVPPGLGDVRLFAPPDSASAAGAWLAAISLVGPLCLEAISTFNAKKIVHAPYLHR